MPSAEVPLRARTEGPPAARRTITIRGQVAPPPRPYAPPRRGRPRRPSERIAGTRPDRAALWAVLMGVFLILVAILSAHGA